MKFYNKNKLVREKHWHKFVVSKRKNYNEIKLELQQVDNNRRFFITESLNIVLWFEDPKDAVFYSLKYS